MNFKVPKVSSVLHFLYGHGWTLLKDTGRSYLLEPPEWMQSRFSERAYMSIPHPAFEKASDYDYIMDIILNNISVVYQMDRKQVEDLLSPTWEDAVNAPAKKQAPLANAA